MNNKELELIGESIWNTYRDMALLFLGETVIPKKYKVKVNSKRVKTQTRFRGRVDTDSDERNA